MSSSWRGAEKRVRPASKAPHRRVDRRTWDTLKHNDAALIAVYFHQSLHGCGWADCTNEYCRSSGSSRVSDSSNDELAAMAIGCLGRAAPVCLDSVNVRRAIRYRVLSQERQRSEAVSKARCDNATACHVRLCEHIAAGVGRAHPALDELAGGTFDAGRSFDIVAAAAADDTGECSSSPLLNYARHVFTDPNAVEHLFVSVDRSTPTFDWQAVPVLIEALLDKVGIQLMNHIDMMCNDLDACLLSIGTDQSAADSYGRDYYHCFLFLFELVLQRQLPSQLHMLIYTMCSRLPSRMCHELVVEWSRRPADWLRERVAGVQQSLAVHALHRGYDDERAAAAAGHHGDSINEDTAVAACVRTLRLLYMAALLGGDADTLLTDDRAVARDAHELDLVYTPDWDAALDHWSVRTPRLPYDTFTSDTLSDCLNPSLDYRHYFMKSDGRSGNPNYTAFLPDHAFAVSAEQRMRFLLIDNKVKMDRSIRHSDMMRFILMGGQFAPYLQLHVRRTHAVQDALTWLGNIVAESPEDLRKQLRVKFDNEDGVDEGGPSKEFYQIIVEDLFNPDYGMFEYSESTRTYWFSRDCTTCAEEYKLIGVLFGLAIYNSIQVAVRFPLVLYRKLLSRPGCFADLADFDPVLHSSLLQVLQCDPEEVQATFGCSMAASYTNVYGELVNVPLCPNGDNVEVDGGNRSSYCELYADWLLNKSVSEQFAAFYGGFTTVCDTKLLARLFGPEQVEQVVCGQEDFDWDVLKPKTYYDQGYSSDSAAIRYFWEVVSEMSREDKRLLLQFCTGCDRAPLGGLAKMPFVIVRNGDHSDRLPTAQTCYNLLLLPEYNSKEWLSDRLLKAIREGRGFGLA